jgi:tetratricopeptide (TPR) repeat protein
MSESSMPIRAKSELKAALNALDTRNYAEAVSQFRKATEEAPRFAPGWHALGVVLDHQDAIKESREAFEKAIGSDSRFIPAYITLVHTCSKLKDWDCVVKTADALSKADKKKNYPDVCFHRGVAQYKLNNLDQAAANVQETIRLILTGFREPIYAAGSWRPEETSTELAASMSRYLDLTRTSRIEK